MRLFWLCALSLILSFTLCAEDEDPEIDDALTITLADPLTFFDDNSDTLLDVDAQPSSIIHKCVNDITGSFLDHEEDLFLEGVSPLVLTRQYCSFDHNDGSLFHGWNPRSPN